MSFDFGRILQSKQEFRRRFAAMPITEKLAMLDALRERTLALRGDVNCPPGSGNRQRGTRFLRARRQGNQTGMSVGPCHIIASPQSGHSCLALFQHMDA
jgi:hypothetical protein